MKTKVELKQYWWMAGGFTLILLWMALSLQAQELQDLPTYALQLFNERLHDNSPKLEHISIRFLFDKDFYWRNRVLRRGSGIEVVFNMSSVNAYQVKKVHVAFVEMFRAMAQYVLDVAKVNDSYSSSKPIRQTNDTEVFDITSLFHFWEQTAGRDSDNFAFIFNVSGFNHRETARFLKNTWRNGFMQEPKRMARSSVYLIVYCDDVDIDLRADMPSQYARRAKLRAPANQVPLCKVYDYTVNFKQLGYLKIIHPKSANIRYCFGRCSDRDASLHALFPQQARQKSSNPAAANLSKLLPCCAPAQLTGLNVMTREDDGSIIQRNYRDVVVSSCKCR